MAIPQPSGCSRESVARQRGASVRTRPNSVSSDATIPSKRHMAGDRENDGGRRLLHIEYGSRDGVSRLFRGGRRTWTTGTKRGRRYTLAAAHVHGVVHMRRTALLLGFLTLAPVSLFACSSTKNSGFGDPDAGTDNGTIG